MDTLTLEESIEPTKNLPCGTFVLDTANTNRDATTHLEDAHSFL